MASEILIYQTENGETRIDVTLENENVWLSKAQLSLLYQCDRTSISKHIKKIYKEGELNENSTCAFFAQVRDEGARSVQRAIPYYNLDMILSIGYRVNSHIGTQFRIWANDKLKGYIIKGFTIDDEKLKQTNNDYFQELLDRIRDIRTSEKVFYQKIKDIYATSIDYDPKNDVSQKFFSVVQNKLLWAISGKTAAEIIYKRSDARQPYMGLTSWSNQSKGGDIKKIDVTVSKNYLQENEIKNLGLLVEQYLAFAEAQALNRKPMYMKDWVTKLNHILTLNDKEILEHAGQISKEMADRKANEQFNIYKEQLKKLDTEKSFKELEQDVKKITGGN